MKKFLVFITVPVPNFSQPWLNIALSCAFSFFLYCHVQSFMLSFIWFIFSCHSDCFFGLNPRQKQTFPRRFLFREDFPGSVDSSGTILLSAYVTLSLIAFNCLKCLAFICQYGNFEIYTGSILLCWFLENQTVLKGIKYACWVVILSLIFHIMSGPTGSFLLV